MLFFFRVGRGWLVVSFLGFYALQTAARAYVMRHHLPPEVLFLGTLGAPSFFLFVFSPKQVRRRRERGRRQRPERSG